MKNQKNEKNNDINTHLLSKTLNLNKTFEKKCHNIDEEKQLHNKLLAEFVQNEFKRRQEEKRSLEAQWLLNMNYLAGNQYCDINNLGTLSFGENKFNWQINDCFNHIAPIIERRLSKLARVRPKMCVFPATTKEEDMKSAKRSKKILEYIYSNQNISNIIMETTNWSEICGTGFYKVFWNKELGFKVAKFSEYKSIPVGDVQVESVSPFAIFPDSNSANSIEDCHSIIHAIVCDVNEINSKWNKNIEGENVDTYSCSNAGILNLSSAKINKSVKQNSAVVLEYYEKKSNKYPNGRFVVVCGEEVLEDSALPYVNQKNDERGFPFIKQDAIPQVGSFWGTSVINRLIPLQKAYNAVKNRKHEYYNRFSVGVLAVEDGSVDVDNLEEEGLCPGKVLVYRQGANVPKFMENEKTPWDFVGEEEALSKEFSRVSGISDVFSENYYNKQLSGTAIELLVEQDENRILLSIDNMRNAIKLIGEHIIRLYKQNMIGPRLAKSMSNNGDFDLFYFEKSDLTSDEIVFDTKNERTDSFSQKRQLIFDLLEKGLFTSPDGKISSEIKLKILEALNFGNFETISDLDDLHKNKAERENNKFKIGEFPEAKDFDNHEIHIREHTAYLISSTFENDKKNNPKLELYLTQHITNHKALSQIEKENNS